jgi:Cof subfamily protein (haloacid dehalogenase superfamily)
VIKLIGIDVDGTLVGSSGVIHPRVWDAADEARAAGIHLILCSGRPAFGLALDYARRLDPHGWHVFQNGASIVHLGTKQSRSVRLPPECVSALVAEARATGEVLELYSDSDYVVESTSPWAREHADLLGVPFEPRSFESFEEPIVRAQWLLPAERANLVSAKAHRSIEIAQSSSPLMRGTVFVGLTREGVSKGSAIRAVAAEYGIDMREAMYVGDAPNDLPALRIVGQPVAMSNADPAVIHAAKRTVGHVDDGGLAEALLFAVHDVA